MGHIISLHGDPHRDTQELLPWYVANRLDRVDRALVEAHLSDCADCQLELETERRLAADVARLPLDTELGWGALRRRMEVLPRSRRVFEQPGRAIEQALAWPGKFGWLLAGQAVLAASFAFILLPNGDPALYRTLGGVAVQGGGNVIVIFRPDAREQELRLMLNDNDARFVDGPTSAGAYVLRVPPARRNSILAVLRSQPDVVLAQPVDADVRR
jgi:hypothetical protein